jgi:hypothetical protein
MTRVAIRCPECGAFYNPFEFPRCPECLTFPESKSLRDRESQMRSAPRETGVRTPEERERIIRKILVSLKLTS